MARERWIGWLITLAMVLGTTLPASAEDGELDVDVSASAGEVEWNEDWEEFRWWEYGAVAVMGAGGLTAKFILPPPGPDDDVFGEAPRFDQSIYAAIKPNSQAALDGHAMVSDIGFYGSMAFLFADSMLAGIIHDEWELAYQMLMMDLEVLSMIAGSLWWPHYFGLGRERPGYGTCGDGDHIGMDCSDTEIQYRSWYAGHGATAMAAAGATCTHHYFNPLYGGGFGDAAICGAMIGVGIVTGVERAVSGRHWPTDVLAGWAVGAAAGWLLPTSLHYGFRKDKESKHATSLMILPTVYQGDHPGFALSTRW